MKLVSTMVDLEGGTASLGLFGDQSEAEPARPPHVQVTVPVTVSGTTEAVRTAAVEAALVALDDARRALKDTL